MKKNADDNYDSTTDCPPSTSEEVTEEKWEYSFYYNLFTFSQHYVSGSRSLQESEAIVCFDDFDCALYELCKDPYTSKFSQSITLWDVCSGINPRMRSSFLRMFSEKNLVMLLLMSEYEDNDDESIIGFYDHKRVSYLMHTGERQLKTSVSIAMQIIDSHKNNKEVLRKAETSCRIKLKGDIDSTLQKHEARPNKKIFCGKSSSSSSEITSRDYPALISSRIQEQEQDQESEQESEQECEQECEQEYEQKYVQKHTPVLIPPRIQKRVLEQEYEQEYVQKRTPVLIPPRIQNRVQVQVQEYDQEYDQEYVQVHTPVRIPPRFNHENRGGHYSVQTPQVMYGYHHSPYEAQIPFRIDYAGHSPFQTSLGRQQQPIPFVHHTGHSTGQTFGTPQQLFPFYYHSGHSTNQPFFG